MSAVVAFLILALLLLTAAFWVWQQGLNPKKQMNLGSDLELSKKILSHPSWPDRMKPKTFIHLTSFGKPLGLINGCGQDHNHARHITLKILHQIGAHNSRQMEELIVPAVSQHMDQIKDRVKGSDTSGTMLWYPKRQFQPHIFTIIWALLFGQRIRPDDPIIVRLLENFEDCNKYYNASLFFRAGVGRNNNNPVTKVISLLKLLRSWWKSSHDIYDIASEIILERKEKKVEYMGSCNANFIDAVLFDFENLNSANKLSDEAFLVILRDMIAGGADSIGSVMEFAVLHLALNPSVQKKVQEEIDRVVGRSRLPSYGCDHMLMTYMQATILETLRMATALQPGARIANKDCTVNGIFFPQGSVVTINSFAIHHSKELWADPDAFRPERFLSPDGACVENREKIIPYGYGKRMCVGKNLAQTALFLYLSTLLQHFRLEIPQELPRPSLKTLRGLSRSPVPYCVRLCLRN